MMDERPKTQLDLMDYVRGVAFGYSKGESLASYWKKHNTDYATVDMRLGVKATKEVAFQFMVNNLLNKEYSYRPMAVAAPRTFCCKDGYYILNFPQESEIEKKKTNGFSPVKNRWETVCFLELSSFSFYSHS